MGRLETELGKHFAKLRKDFTGTGAVDTQVRICADSLFIRYKVSFTPLEKAMIGRLTDENGWVSIPNYAEKAKIMINHLMLTFFPFENIKVKNLFTKIFLDEHSEASYWLVVLDQNIEKLTRK